MKKLFFFILILQFNYSFSNEYFNFNYKIEKGDTFSLILQKFVKDDSIINAETPLVKKIRKNNPHILDWGKLVQNQYIKMYISEDFFEHNKYKEYETANLQKIKEEIELKKGSTIASGFKASIFYMNSSGSFTQDTPDSYTISFKQNSPLTLGASFSYYPKDSNYSFSQSSYFSILRSPPNPYSNQTVNVPTEIGTNIFGEYRLSKYNIIVYGGPDFEKFSSFNPNYIIEGADFYLDSSSIVFLTVGISKIFTIFDKKFLIKASISKDIISKYQSNLPENLNSSEFSNTPFSGTKLMLYGNYKFADKFFLHTLIKYHTLTGPSDLGILRLGFGIGFIIF